MSLINDALKEARRNPPRNPPTPPSSLPPLADDDSPVAAWLVPAILLVVIVAVIFFIGFAAAHHTVRTLVNVPPPEPTQAVAVVTPPPPVTPVENTNSGPALNPPDAPLLQGVFYSTTAPTAIVDGRNVAKGDRVGKYRVKEISKYTVTLVDAEGKTMKIGMSN